MDKTIGYELIVRGVHGFDDARAQMQRLIRDGIVKCGQCDAPATHIFFQDQAEFYIRCDAHPESGRQWTGSTRWAPSAFSINVLKDKAEAWLETLAFDERNRFKLRSYDATNYYALMFDDDRDIRHYLRDSADEGGGKVYVDIHPLTNGAYAYTLTYAHLSANGSGTVYSNAVQGMWETEAEALEAAKAEVKVQS